MTKLKTVDDVKNYISQTEKEIKDITNIRQKYRNKLRNCTDDDLIKDYKTKRDKCTEILSKYRKNLKIANYIIEDMPNVKKVITIEKQMIKGQEDISKIKKKIDIGDNNKVISNSLIALLKGFIEYLENN